MTIRSRPTLRDLHDLGRQLELDREATPSSLRHRDRKTAREAPELPASPTRQLLYWLELMRAENAELAGDRINTLHRLGLLILAAAGALAGWGASAVVFRYDGSHPVNVINVLVVFVAIQLVMLLFFVFSVLPTSVTRWLPGMRTLREIMSLVSPGRIQQLFNRFLPQAYRDRAGAFLGKGIAHRKLYGSVERWVTIHSSQTFAVFFNLGALASVLYLVAFSDLAFSWSTTLQVEATDLRRWTDLLSAPWAGLFPDARPSQQLIESTRYFRLQDGSFPSAVSPVGLGGWWPFLIMSMLVYGLVPRLITWFVARQRFRSALNASFRSFPGVGDVLARLNSELVETAAQGQENGIADRDGDVQDVGAQIDIADRSVTVVDWSAVVDDETQAREWLRQSAGVNAISWNRAGGALPIEQDARTIDDVAEQAGGVDVLVLVKSWEPPMAELFDFLRELRAQVPQERMILIAPVGIGEDGSASPADSEGIDTWRSAVARTGDPWMHVLWLGESR
jgi:hypothetical protein